MSTKIKSVTYSKLFRFFLPLAATPFMIGLTHSIINAALARLPFPELSIAIFTLIKGLVSIISSPTLMSLQLVVSFVDNYKSYKLTMKFISIMAGVLFCIILLMAYTSLGGWLLINFFSLTEEKQIKFAYDAFRIVCFLPLVQILRNSYQGLAVGLKQTKLFVPGIALRLTFISLFMWWAVKTQAVSGAIAGSVSWVVGIGIEGIFIISILLYYYKSLDRAIANMPPRNKHDLTMMDLLKFFLPLGLMMSMGAFLQPIIQSGISHSQLPTRSLAAYGIAWSVVALIAGPLGMLHQLALVFTDKVNGQNWNKIRHFTLLTGAGISSMIVFVALSTPGYWLINRVIGVSPQVTFLARKVMLAFSLYPLIRSFRETYWGILMGQRTTNIIGLAKAANIITVILSIIISLFIFKASEAAVLGALSFTAGETIESLVIWSYTINKKLTASG